MFGGIVLGIEDAHERIVAGEMDLFEGGWIHARRIDLNSFIDKVGFAGDANVDLEGALWFEVREEVVGEELHHGQAVFEGGGFGGFICILGGEEEE